MGRVSGHNDIFPHAIKSPTDQNSEYFLKYTIAYLPKYKEIEKDLKK